MQIKNLCIVTEQIILSVICIKKENLATPDVSQHLSLTNFVVVLYRKYNKQYTVYLRHLVSNQKPTKLKRNTFTNENANV
ncbi:hypothetical protein T07_4248 [Trichinella nelsoni]|uniref:Uncharacterized protein n=1 Tax=Trichinella nelsoni TaxID=6336 RepID=A0A0V0RUY2_9BILA|nr:hypothetical protein T07_4248 [Trichinella nelsoni]